METTSIPFLLIMLFFSSCATFLNPTFTSVKVETNQHSLVINGVDTFHTQKNKVRIPVQRSKDDLIIQIKTDQNSKRIALPAQNSFLYFLNIPTNFGIGMLIDKNQSKRYGYPQYIFVNANDLDSDYSSISQAAQKGRISLLLELPYVNNFSLNPPGETRQNNTGFLGIGVGLEWHYAEHQFIHLSANGVLDFMIPVPAPVDYIGEYENMISTYLLLTHQHRINRWAAGYGLSFSRNTWRLNYQSDGTTPPPSRAPIQRSTNALGLALPIQYYISERTGVVLLYRPSFLQFDTTTTFEYEHLISLGVSWKIGL